MICQHLMNLNLLGVERPARIYYEPDPDNGFPCITAVEIVRAMRRIGYTEHIISIDMFPILDEADLSYLEQTICKDRLSWQGAA